MAYIPCRELQHLSRRQKQECPLCGQLQTIMMRGKTHDIEDDTLGVVGDRGYSFCNCHNIFYTSWANIDENIESDLSKLNKIETEKAWKLIQPYYPIPKNILVLGSDSIMNHISQNNWSNAKVTDLIKHGATYDIIWLSHFIN